MTVIVLGAGPAGLTAALHLAADGEKVVLLEREASVGGAAKTSAAIETLVGWQSTPGRPPCEAGKASVESMGGEVVLGYTGTTPLPGQSTLWGECTDLVVATGVSLSIPSLPGCDEGLKAGRVRLGAGAGDEALVRGRHVLIVGAGNSAGQAACHARLSGAASVRLVARRTLTAMSSYLVSRLRLLGVEILVEYRVVEFGDGHTVLDGPGGKLTLRPCDVAYLCIGGRPNVPAELVGAGLRLDSQGYIETQPSLETSLPRVFAAGDVRSGATRRWAAAAGDGAVAAATVYAALDRRSHGDYRG